MSPPGGLREASIHQARRSIRMEGEVTGPAGKKKQEVGRRTVGPRTRRSDVEPTRRDVERPMSRNRRRTRRREGYNVTDEGRTQTHQKRREWPEYPAKSQEGRGFPRYGTLYTVHVITCWGFQRGSREVVWATSKHTNSVEEG
ncbi:hypothetical protein NDU88_005184 [Pleurodeles waltl]|uniref:Uncharacterized protein n=1 Tax=Pleurodeles waltl TaxID=8319 RepID=A0AAV7UL58_PLEWA|nr:hypothetical protein NDU88_005184 [Pleurodeles waltl]